MSKWSYGSIRATHCAVQIGYGNGLQSYVGLIDDVRIQVCLFMVLCFFKKKIEKYDTSMMCRLLKTNLSRRFVIYLTT